MNRRSFLLFTGAVLLSLSVPARAGEAEDLRQAIEAIVREYSNLGKKPFETKWPGGNVREKYETQADGTQSYTRFFPGGGFAVRFQKKPSKAIYYERWWGNGKTRELLNYDERIIAYTSYWENGNHHQKFMLNKQTKERSYQRYDQDGKQVVPSGASLPPSS
ncbi:MAG: hypothetical protein AB1758_07725 [Candidatus Eremiobacterota bacterium]